MRDAGGAGHRAPRDQRRAGRRSSPAPTARGRRPRCSRARPRRARVRHHRPGGARRRSSSRRFSASSAASRSSRCWSTTTRTPRAWSSTRACRSRSRKVFATFGTGARLGYSAVVSASRPQLTGREPQTRARGARARTADCISMELETPHGPARATCTRPREPRATLVLGHGAGGGVGAPDLKAATEAALAVNVTVVARRAALPRRRAQVRRARARSSTRPGSRSSSSCRSTGCRSTSAAAPQARASRAGRRRRSARPACSASRSRCTRPGGRRRRGCRSSRQVTVPVLIVQGESDPFGMPPEAPDRTVVRLRATTA